MHYLILFLGLFLFQFGYTQDYPGISYEYQSYYSNGHDQNGEVLEVYLLDKKDDEMTLTHFQSSDSLIPFIDRPNNRNGFTIGNVNKVGTCPVTLLNDSTITWTMLDDTYKISKEKKLMVYTATISEDWSGQAADMQFIMDCSFYEKGYTSDYPGSKEKPYRKIMRTHSIYIGH